MSRERAVERISRSRRAVLKIGTSLITESEPPYGVNRQMIEKIGQEVLFLRERNIQTLLVSSGAVAMGREVLRGVTGYTPLQDPALVRKQALAAIGQSRLMALYAEYFERLGIPTAQLLVTARGFRDRRAYLNVGNTLEELIAMGVLPIVNENDTVSTEELNYGDNDILSAACTALFRADLLIILTSVAGFLMDGRRIPFLSRIGPDQRAQAGGPDGPGRGGMTTKLRAGELCLRGGEILAILPGGAPDPVQGLFRGDDIGTVIAGERRRKLSARKRWLLYVRTTGSVVIDGGARRALVERGSSLLPAGIIRLKGRFLAGDVIDCEDETGAVIGRGICNYSYRELLPLLGRNADELRQRGLVPRTEEVIHRNNMILEREDQS